LLLRCASPMVVEASGSKPRVSTAAAMGMKHNSIMQVRTIVKIIS
jgi:hypothetical protein